MNEVKVCKVAYRKDITEDDLKEVPDIVLRWMVRHAKGNDLAVVGGVMADRYFGPLPTDDCKDLVQRAREATCVEEMRSIGRAWRAQLLRQS